MIPTMIPELEAPNDQERLGADGREFLFVEQGHEFTADEWRDGSRYFSYRNVYMDGVDVWHECTYNSRPPPRQGSGLGALYHWAMNPPRTEVWLSTLLFRTGELPATLRALGAVEQPCFYGPDGYAFPILPDAKDGEPGASAEERAVQVVLSPEWARWARPDDEPYLAYAAWLKEHQLNVDRKSDSGAWVIYPKCATSANWTVSRRDFEDCLAAASSRLGVPVPAPPAHTKEQKERP